MPNPQDLILEKSNEEGSEGSEGSVQNPLNLTFIELEVVANNAQDQTGNGANTTNSLFGMFGKLGEQTSGYFQDTYASIKKNLGETYDYCKKNPVTATAEIMAVLGAAGVVSASEIETGLPASYSNGTDAESFWANYGLANANILAGAGAVNAVKKVITNRDPKEAALFLAAFGTGVALILSTQNAELPAKVLAATTEGIFLVAALNFGMDLGTMIHNNKEAITGAMASVATGCVNQISDCAKSIFPCPTAASTSAQPVFSNQQGVTTSL